MSGINKSRIRERIKALQGERDRLSTLIAQYDAAIGELLQLLEPGAQPIQNGARIEDIPQLTESTNDIAT